MPKVRTLVVRCDESLIQLIQETAKILERKESETVRILLHRACKYWIARGQLTKTSNMITTINEQGSQTPLATDDDEIAKLQEAMKLLK